MEAGYVFGYNGVIGCPDVGRSLSDPGYFAQMWKPRSVAAVSARCCVVNKDFLVANLDALPETLDLAMLGPWLGGLAFLSGRRVVYSPYMEARVTASAILNVSDADAAAYREVFDDFLNSAIGYAPRLSKSGRLAYQAANDGRAIVLPSYRDYIDGLTAKTCRRQQRRPDDLDHNDGLRKNGRQSLP